MVFQFLIRAIALSVAMTVVTASRADVTEDATNILDTASVTGGFVVHLGVANGELTAALPMSWWQFSRPLLVSPQANTVPWASSPINKPVVLLLTPTTALNLGKLASAAAAALPPTFWPVRSASPVAL